MDVILNAVKNLKSAAERFLDKLEMTLTNDRNNTYYQSGVGNTHP